MNSQTQFALYFLGAVLLIAGAIILGQQISGSEPVQYLVPCILLVSGAGTFGLGLFWPASGAPQPDCLAPGESSAKSDATDQDDGADGGS
jgi:hypothetical protein